MTTKNKCALPPTGWYCTRTPGHEGPCAAYQNDSDEWALTSERVPEIDYSLPEYSRGVQVLGYRDGRVMEFDYRSQGYNSTERGRLPRWYRGGRTEAAPTHWRPMPAPPRGSAQ